MDIQNQMPLLEPLTEREEEILKLMADGLTNREISDQLVIEFETVRWHTKNIYSKLGVHTRTQAILRVGNMRPPDAPAPVQAVAPPRSNLPHYATSFVGRESELDEIIGLLHDPNVRLVTIAGQGGMGKTRLSVEAAHAVLPDFADGAFFVPLYSLNSADEVIPAIARGLNLRLHAGSEFDQLVNYLAGKHLLLLLDSFEHVMDAVSVVDDILSANASIKILVTSHLALNLSDEWIRHLEGIEYPTGDDVERLEDYDAIRLFRDRVQRVRGDFSIDENRDCVIELCRLLYGMPLAIELAAGWLKILSCEDVIREIRGSIDFLVTRQRDADLRHQSISVVFDYSWRLLTDDERRVFRRLSVFRGGFGRSAAEQVAGASIGLLADLVDKSFLYENAAGLYETHDLLRQYAENQLAKSSEQLSIQSRMIYAMASLVKGNFEVVGTIGGDIMDTMSHTPNRAEQAFGMALLSVLGGVKEEEYDQSLQLAEASISLMRSDASIRDPITVIFAHLGLAIAYCGFGDYLAAARAIQPALEHAATMRGPAFVTLCLPVMAIIHAHEAEPEEALKRLALVFTHPASTTRWLEKWPLLVALNADLQAELGEEGYRRAWEQGRAQSLEVVAAEFLKAHHAG
jgi:predicted ATPase/DNA-binding CsgD family transcriptional regulator